MPAGRPRTTTPPPEEVIKLGEELVAWAMDTSEQAKKEKRWRFCDWYSLVHGMTDNEWDLLVKAPEFCGYYKKAQSALASKWLDGTICPSIAHRFIRIYCPEVKKEEDETKEADIRLKALAEADAKQEISEEAMAHYKSLIHLLTQNQGERKIAKTKVPKE